MTKKPTPPKKPTRLPTEEPIPTWLWAIVYVPFVTMAFVVFAYVMGYI